MGHIAGDRLLVSIAEVIRSHIRATDTGARYGGDEFAVILPGCSLKQGTEIAETILDAVSRLEAIPGKQASLSIGLVAWKDPMDDHTIISCADEALYQSKSRGRGVITVYGSHKKQSP